MSSPKISKSAISSLQVSLSPSSTQASTPERKSIEKPGNSTSGPKTACVFQQYLDEINGDTTTTALGSRKIRPIPSERKRSASETGIVQAAAAPVATTIEQATEHPEPAKKKQKARKAAVSEDDTKITPQRKPKTASEEEVAPKKPVIDEWDRAVKNEQARIAFNASKGKLATGKFRRSFNDSVLASRMNRNRAPVVNRQQSEAALPAPPQFYQTFVATAHIEAQMPAPFQVTVARMSQAAHVQKSPDLEKPQEAPKSQEMQEAQSRADSPIHDDPNFKIVDLKKVKFLRTGPNSTVTAAVENVVKAPEMYPNIEIAYDAAKKPIHARVTKFDRAQWDEMLAASKLRAQKQRREAAQEVRKLAKQANGGTQTGCVTKAVKKTAKKAVRGTDMS